MSVFSRHDVNTSQIVTKVAIQCALFWNILQRACVHN